MMKTSTLTFGLVGALACAATISYWIASWYLSMLWSTLVPDQDMISHLSIYTIKRLPLSVEFGMLHWHLLALGSLVFNALWARKRVRNSENLDGLALPVSCHVTWLCLAMFLHIGGGLASVVAVAYTLG